MSLIVYKPRLAARFQKRQRITIKQAILGLIVLCSAAIALLFVTRLPAVMKNAEFIIGWCLEQRYYFFNGSGIDFYTESCVDNEKVIKKILEAIDFLKIKLGPPVYTGKALLLFNQSSEYGQTQPTVNIIGREIQFPSIQELLSLDTRRYYHELIHLLYTDEKAYMNLPDFAIEGITEALAWKCSGVEDCAFNASLKEYYLNSLSGFIEPDAEFRKLQMNKREFYYYFGKIFFQRIAEIDELLLYEILRNPPHKKMNWTDFIRWMVTITDKPDEMRDTINTTYIFSPLTKELYIIPAMEIDRVITMHIFTGGVNSCMGQISCAAKHYKAIESLEKKIFIDNGYTRIDLPWKFSVPVREIEINLIIPGRNYNKIIKLN